MNPSSFIVVGDDWGGHPSSVQHIFRRLARSHPTVWLNTVGLRPPRLDLRDAERVARKVRKMLLGDSPKTTFAQHELSDDGLSLRVLAPLMAPWMRPSPLRALNRASVRRALNRAVTEMGIREPILVSTVPNGIDAVGVVGERAVVYYCVDDFANWPGCDAIAASAMERELLAVSDVVLATSDNLANTRKSPRGPTELFPHGVDIDHFARASDSLTVPLEGVRRSRPVLGYLGLVDERLDVALLVSVAQSHPEWDIVFVGPTDRAPSAQLDRANVRFFPSVSYSRVPEALAAFDVALLPYVRNELTKSINPLKLREYLASGRPVVATSLPEVTRFLGHVAIADTPDDFSAAVTRALAGARDLRESRKDLVRADGWEARAESFLAHCEAAALRRRHNR